MKKISLLTVCILLISIPLISSGANDTDTKSSNIQPKNVILIGWDGAQRDHVKELLEKNELPNIKQLASEGALVAMDALRKTETVPGWAEILTGYYPEVTGTYSNVNFGAIPEGLTIFERLENHFGAENIFTAAVSNWSGYHVSAEPGSDKVISEELTPALKTKLLKIKGSKIIQDDNGVYHHIIPDKPYLNAKKSMDAYKEKIKTNDEATNIVMDMIENNKDGKFFIFFHIIDVDKAGHKSGENSDDYSQALINSDKSVGLIMNKLKEAGIYDDTLVYVTSDHGFDEGLKGHSDAPYIFLSTNDKNVMRRGFRVDLTATILDRMGVDLSTLTPSLDGHPLTKPYEAPLW